MVEDFLSFLCLYVHVLYFISNLVMLETYYIRISASHIYFCLALVFISSFIWSRFIYDLYLCVDICVISYVYFILQQGIMKEQSDWIVHPVKYVWNKRKCVVHIYKNKTVYESKYGITHSIITTGLKKLTTRKLSWPWPDCYVWRILAHSISLPIYAWIIIIVWHGLDSGYRSWTIITKIARS